MSKRIEVRKLDGAALSWAVGKCEWYHEKTDWSGQYSADYMDWTNAGPIIQREKFESFWNDEGEWWSVAGWDHRGKCEVAMRHPSFLVAILRCYVAVVMGPEIDVPDELLTVRPEEGENDE